MKITGMNPRGGARARGRAARLLPPAGLEADRRDRRRAVRELRARVPDHLRAVLVERRRASPTTQVGRDTKLGTPAAAVLQPGDRIVAVDGARGDAGRRSAQVDRHAPVRRRRRRTAARPRRPCALVGRARRAARRRSASGPATTPPTKRMLRRLRVRATATRAVGPLRAAGLALDTMWTDHDATARRDRADLRARGSASRSRGVVGAYKVDAAVVLELDTAQAIFVLGADLAVARRSSTCSRSCRSTAATSSGRSPRRCAARAIPFASWSARAWSASCSCCMLFFIGLSQRHRRGCNGEGFNVALSVR